MEKVTIKSAVDSGRKFKNGKPIINVTLEDGRKGSCTELEIINKIGSEIELEQINMYRDKFHEYLNS